MGRAGPRSSYLARSRLRSAGLESPQPGARLRAPESSVRQTARCQTPLAPSAFRWLVGEDDQTAGARPGVNKPHGHVWTSVTEEALAAAKDHWMQPELIFIDEPVLHQRFCQIGAAHDENRLSKLALELCNF